MTKAEQIAQLNRLGFSHRKIANVMGISKDCVRKVLWASRNREKLLEYNKQYYQRTKLTPDHNRKRPSPSEVAAYAEKHTYQETAVKFGLTRSAVSGIVYRARQKEAAE